MTNFANFTLCTITHFFTDICAPGCSTKQIALIVILFITSIFSAALFLKFTKCHDSYLEQSAYPGDTVLLVKGLKPFWKSQVVVTEDGSVQNEWEVNLFMEQCGNLMPYYVQSRKSEPHNLTSDGDPVRILEHRSDLNNYFISGSVSVMLTFFITTSVEMDLCIFDNIKWYQEFYENPTREAKQNAWEPCTRIFPKFPSTTVILNYTFSDPGYYFIAVAPAEPVHFSLQYALDLQQKIYNHSDYKALNCSVTSGSKCDIPVNGLLNFSEICILAFDPVLPSEDEDYIPLQVNLQCRVFNFVSIVFGSLCLVSFSLLIVVCIITLTYCIYKLKKH